MVAISVVNANNNTVPETSIALSHWRQLLAGDRGSFRRPCHIVIARLEALGLGWRFHGPKDALKLLKFFGFDDRTHGHHGDFICHICLEGTRRLENKGKWYLMVCNDGSRRRAFRSFHAYSDDRASRIVTESIAAVQIGQVSVIILRDARLRKQCVDMVDELGHGRSICIVNSYSIPGLIAAYALPLTIVTESVCYADIRKFTCFTDVTVYVIDDAPRGDDR
jgi:hypothetical protein